MLERTQTAVNLLDVMQELELLDVSFLNDGEWIKSTDRKSLYRAAITALLENAQSDGFVVTSENWDMDGSIRNVMVDDATPENDHYEREYCEACGGTVEIK